MTALLSSRTSALALIAAPLLLAGCTIIPSGSRPAAALGPAGQTVRVETANGQSSRLTFRRNGVVTARFASSSVSGRWELRGDDLCFQWANAPRECWPGALPFERRAKTIRSDRGNTVQVTRL